MKRIILALLILLVMILSGCNSNQTEQNKVTDTINTVQGQGNSEPTEISTEVSEPTEMPTEISEPTEIPTEASEPVTILAVNSDGMDSTLPPYLSATKPEITNVFQVLPSKFIFVESTSWATEITLHEDWTFSGKCHSLGATDYSYPFHGKFTQPQKVSEYIYSMELESLAFEEGTDTVYYEYDYENDVDLERVLTVPKGFDQAGEFLLYLPGCPLEELPEEYLPECSINTRIRQTIPSGVYRMYNVSGKAGFMAEDEDSFWSQTYRKDQASLVPNYCFKSELNFSQEDWRSSLRLVFDWNHDTQTQFLATDRNGTGEYNITLEYSEDYRTMIVTAKNTTVFNLEPWGGTADGTISAEFPVNNRLPFDYLETTQEDATIFSMLPSVFRVGGDEIINLNENGTFVGEYSDSTMGSNGPGYSHGLVAICNFSGKFVMPQKVSEYIYSIQLESLEFEETPGIAYFEDNFLYSATEPCGFSGSDKFLVYLPGCPLEAVTFPECPLDGMYDRSKNDLFLLCGFGPGTHQTIPSGVYLLYNVGGVSVYKAEADDCLWNKTYKYNFGLYRSELYPRYSSDSGLVFWPESGAATLSLKFEWTDDTQTEFVATDSNGTGEYNISLDFSEDYNSVIVTLESLSGFNLEPWGGTADGTLSAEYQIQ